jgi:ribosome biogenesis GTPase
LQRALYVIAHAYLRTGEVIHKYDKGRHTTTTATLIRLEVGGYVVDTPGIRALELSIVSRAELEAYFVDIAAFVPDCKFPDCTHIHEGGCAVKDARDCGDIHPDRYDSYVRLFSE